MLTETQTAILPLVPYLDTLHWVIIALAFGGIPAAPWIKTALRYGTIIFALLLFSLTLRRSGERAGRLAQRLGTTEKVKEIQ